MSEFFNEHDADQAVIASLIREVTKLRSFIMPIVKTIEGKFYRVEPDQEMTADEVNEIYSKVKIDLSYLDSLLQPADPPKDPVDPPADVTPAQPEAPVEQSQEQPAPEEPQAPQPEPVVLT